jgi:glycerol-3-phosphate dehydrogenase
VRRDLEGLGATEFDVLVVGAGIYGSAIAWDAAQRGLTVALVERDDFGAGTSFNNAKTLHGGVRSLQSGRLGELREYVRERRALMRIAPHLVRPLPFLVPTSRSLTRNALAFRAYFTAYDLLASDRNRGLDPARHLPASRFLSREECVRLDPVADPSEVTGGVLWHDGQMSSGERMTLAFVTSAVRAGAVAVNHARVTRWLLDGNRVIGAHVRDEISQGELDVRARLTINASGPAALSLLTPLFGGTASPLVPALSLAMNLVTRRVVSEAAVGGFARGRLFFLAPWRDVTIAGTSHDPFTGEAHTLQVSEADIARLLADLNAAFPRAGLRRDDIRLVHRGLLPAASINGTDVRLLKSSIVRDHAEDGRPGLLSVVGVRYTTARHTAAQATDLAGARLGRSLPPCRTHETPLAGGEMPDVEAHLRAAEAEAVAPWTPATSRHLALRYGSQFRDVQAVAAHDPSLAAALAPTAQTLAAEIVYAARAEMAVTLADAVLRRTDLGSAGHPGRPALERAAALMASEREWRPADVEREIERVERFYEGEESA